MFSRAGRAAAFDRKAFTEAFFDDDAAADGAIVVASVGAATYLGWWLRGLAGLSVQGLLQSLVAAIISWLILAFATWFVASRLFQGGGKPQTMMAMHGLAALPLLLEVFEGLASGLIAAAGLVWYLAAVVVATREASDLGTRNAAVSVLIGFAIAAIFRALIGVPFAVFSALF
jgi:hypothetical protein